MNPIVKKQLKQEQKLKKEKANVVKHSLKIIELLILVNQAVSDFNKKQGDDVEGMILIAAVDFSYYFDIAENGEDFRNWVFITDFNGNEYMIHIDKNLEPDLHYAN